MECVAIFASIKYKKMSNKVKKNKGLDDFQVIDVLLKKSQDAVEIYTFREVVESNPESFDCMHKHETYMIMWIKNGHGIHYIDNREYAINGDYLFFLTRSHLHHYDLLKAQDGYCILVSDIAFSHLNAIFNKEMRRNVFDWRQGVAYCKVERDASTDLENHLCLIRNVLQSQEMKVLKQCYLVSALALFIIVAQNKCEWPDGMKELKDIDHSYSLYSEFLSCVEMFYKTQHKSRWYANHLSVSEYVLTSCVRKYGKCSPLSMIIDRIVTEAKRLICQPRFQVKNVAIELGFSDSSNFVKYFKHNVGMTPYQYREYYVAKIGKRDVFSLMPESRVLSKKDLHSISHRIDRLCQFLLLNAYALPSSGLSQGKAGIALTLFVASRLLGKESYENHAFNLLQEALLSKTEDVSFSSGLSGIGYVLYYLISEGYIEADFDELFGDKKKWILERIESLNKQGKDVSLDVTSFLCVFPETQAVGQSLLDGRSSYYETLFKRMAERPSGSFPVEKLMAKWQDDLHLMCSCADFRLPESTVEAYARLHQSGLLKRNPVLGYYFLQMGSRVLSDTAINIGQENWKVQEFLPQELSSNYLHQRLQLSFLRLQMPDSRLEAYNEFMNRYVICDEEVLERSLSYVSNMKIACVGLKYGVARLVLQMCWLCQKEMTETTDLMYHILLS